MIVLSFRTFLYLDNAPEILTCEAQYMMIIILIVFLGFI